MRYSASDFCLKINKMSRLLLAAIFLSLFVSNSFAADFTNDASTAFLSVIFGHVTDSYGSVIQGQKSILGIIFQSFNLFIASVGTAIVFYITTVSVMQSAHSGKPLGDKWHTVFLPMRVVAGAGMLIPNSFGYSYAQVITMWFILTGVQGADAVWRGVNGNIGVVDTLHSQGQAAVTGGTDVGSEHAEFLNPNTGVSEPGGKFSAVDYLTPAIQFATCVGTYGTKLPDSSANTAPVPACSDQYPTCDVIPVALSCSPADCSTEQAVIQPEDPRVQKECGLIDFDNINLQGDIRKNYINGMLGLTTIMANDVRNFFPDYISYFNDKGFYDKSANLSADQIADFTLKLQTINDPIKTFTSLINAAVLDQRIADSTQALPDYERKAKDIGWISAGATYYGIIKNAGKGADLKTIEYYIGSPIAATKSLDQTLSADVIKQINSLRTAINGLPSSNDKSDSVTTSAKITYHNIVLSVIGLGIPNFIEFIIHYVLDTSSLLGYPGEVNITNPDSIRAAIATDPLASIADKGAQIASRTETLFFGILTGLLAGFLAATAAGALPYVGTAITIGVITALLTVAFAALFIMMIFYPIGIMMNVYIPLIPTVIYMTGVIGWLLLCIEAMAAAPIVALGLMHPSGDEILGSAEHGLKLLLNLMLRPVLMVAGLIAGLVVVRIALLFFSVSLSMVISKDTGIIPVTSLGAVGALTFVYIGLVTVIIHKSFSLINEIPNRVMTWIGAQGSSVSGEQEMLQKTEGQVKEGGKTPSEIGSKGASGAKTGFKTAGSITRSPAGAKPPTSGELE